MPKAYVTYVQCGSCGLALFCEKPDSKTVMCIHVDCPEYAKKYERPTVELVPVVKPMDWLHEPEKEKGSGAD